MENRKFEFVAKGQFLSNYFINVRSVNLFLKKKLSLTYSFKFQNKKFVKHLTIENRIYREELNESLGMNFFSPFQPEREFKVYKSCKCSQIICSRVY